MAFPVAKGETLGYEASAGKVETVMTIQDKPMSDLDLGKLMTRFLQQRSADPASIMEEGGEVSPYQAVAVYMVEPRTALDEAAAAADFFLDKQMAAGFRLSKTPPEWAALVRGQETLAAVPLSLGNFPQLVRDVTPLLGDKPLTEMKPGEGRPFALAELEEWGRKMAGKRRWAEALFAAGALRAANQFDAADELLGQVRSAAPKSWDGLLRNEEAALAWQRGDSDEARRLWDDHPADNPAILFNRGLAALFTGEAAAAAPLLARAAAGLPEDGPWQHLARLYLILAESRS